MSEETSASHIPNWHPGELEMQRRAAVGEVSDRGIKSSIPEGAAHFLASQRFAAFASSDDDGRVWASIRIGRPGMLHVIDPFTVETAPLDVAGDPFIDNLRGHPQVGIVVFDPANRRRMRLNGDAEVLPDASLRIHARQVYGNCPQYIQQRVSAEEDPGPAASTPLRGSRLSVAQKRWISDADTFFVASRHPGHDADASHRGGNPGFVHVASSKRLLIPDYSGNRMFNTLGNILVNPRAGLVFPDFERGRILQLSGRASIQWDFDAEAFPGAQRLLDFRIERLIEFDYPALKGYALRGYSPFNPPLPENSSASTD